MTDGWRDFPAVPLPLRVLVCRCVWLRDWRHAGHRAAHWRIWANDRAGAWVTHLGRRVALAPGRLVVLPPNVPLLAAAERPVRHLYLHVAGPPLRAAAAPHVVPVGSETAALVRWFMHDPDAIATDAVACTLRAMRLAAIALEGLVGGGEHHDDRIERAVARITADPAAAPANRALAAAAGMHTDAFVRLFRRRVGTTPHAFALDRRVEEAARLLREGDQPIADIAAALGFTDRYHLSRIFARRMGVPPARWRRGASA